MVRALPEDDDVYRKTEGMTMTTYTGRQTVNAGFYLNTKTYSLETLNQAGELPGNDLDTYRHVPMLALLAAAPLLGLAFVMFLPFVGFAMVLHLVGKKAYQLVTDAATEGVRVLRPSWAPAFAFLTRSKPAKPATDEPAATPEADAWKDDVEKQLHQDDRDAK